MKRMRKISDYLGNNCHYRIEDCIAFVYNVSVAERY